MRSRVAPESTLLDGSDEALDALEVPAAVVCTRCGSGDCAGCSQTDHRASGVTAIVPWERPGESFGARLYETALATTVGGEGFFLVLPDGSVAAALRFAALAEVLAVSSTACVLTPLAVLGIPGLLERCLSSGGTRATVALATLVGVVGFTLLLVGAHAVHGLVLGRAVTRSRALRFGLYACGWDFGSSPAGFGWAAWRAGGGAAWRLFGASLMSPSRAVDAALRGFELDVKVAARAKRRAMQVAMIVSVPAVMLVLALMATVALFAV
jgi:hypothetical protein